MSNLTKLQDIEQKFHYLSQAGAYADALDLATREAHLFPAHSQAVIYLWRITMACRLEDVQLSLRLLQEAIAAGHWYNLHDDPDLHLLHGKPEFEQLVVVCEQRRAQAIANAVPLLKTLRADGGDAPYPLLLALHGAQSNVEAFARHWVSATASGWFVGLPQSSQAFGAGTYSWNDWAWAQQEIQTHYATLCKAYPIDPQRIILAGFSQGGGVAAWLALSGIIPVRGLVLVGPYLPDVQNLIPFLEAGHTPDLRAYIVAGQRDKHCYGIAQQLASLFPRYGIVSKLDIYADVEHAFPVGFESRVPYALEFVLQS